MEQVSELDKNNKPPIGSYEAMKPWFDRIDALYEEFLRLEREGLLEEK